MSSNKGRDAIRRALKRDLAPRAVDPNNPLAITAPQDPIRPQVRRQRREEQDAWRAQGVDAPRRHEESEEEDSMAETDVIHFTQDPPHVHVHHPVCDAPTLPGQMRYAWRRDEVTCPACLVWLDAHPEEVVP